MYPPQSPAKVPANRRSPRIQRNHLLKRLNISRRLRLCYVSNPKVASSTIKLCLQRAELNDPDFIPRTGVHHRPSSPLLTWPELRDMDLNQALTDCSVFSFVRNPFDRLRAVYINKILHPRKQGAFRIRAGFAPGHTPSFADFIAAICDQDPELADPHWRPQYMNLACAQMRYDRIGKLEHFTTDWAAIAMAHGLSTRPQRVGRRTTTIAYSEVVFCADSIARIVRAYAQDFEHFSYPKNPDHIANHSAFAGTVSLPGCAT